MNNEIIYDYVETMKRIISLLKTQQLITFELINISQKPELENLILQKAEEKLIKMKYEDLISSDKALIITALSIIAFKKYDANFWDHVHNQFKTLYGNRYDLLQHIDSEIRNLIRPYIPKSYTQSTIIGWVLLHCIVPEKYILDFYSILSIIYLYDLRCQIPDDFNILEGLLKTIFKQIEKRTIQDNDNIQSKVMNQSYKFIRSTREVVTTNSYRNTLATFARYVIMSIANKVNYNENWTDIPSFFLIWGEKWFESRGRTQIENRRKTSLITDNNIKWKVEFGIENQKLVLYTKTVFLSPDIDFKKVKVEIISNEKRVYFNERPRIIENDLSFELSTFPIKVDFDPFNIKIIVHGTDIKPEEIISDYLLFNIETGKRISNRLYEYPSLYVVSKTFDGDNIHLLLDTPYYRLGVLDTSKMDYYTVNNQHKFIKESINPYIIGDLHNQITFKINEEMYDIFTDSVSYYFSPTNKIADYLLWVNNQFIEMNNVVEPKLVEIPPSMLIEGINEIYLTNQNIKKIPLSEIKFFYDTRLIMNIVNDNLYFHSTKITKKISNIRGVSPIEIMYSKDKFFIVNPFIPMVKDLTNNFILLNDYIWHSDFKFYENVVFKGIDATHLVIHDDNGQSFSSNIYGIRDKYHGIIFEVPATPLKTANKNLIFTFYKKDVMVYTIPFLNAPIVDKGSIKLVEIDEHDVVYTIENIIGKGNFSLDIYRGSKLFNCTVVKTFPYKFSLINTGIHNYKFVLKDQKNIIDTRELFCIDLNTLENQLLKITDIQILTSNKKTKYLTISSQSLRRTYLKITEYLGDNCFNGEIIYKEKTGEYNSFKVIDVVDIYMDLPIINRKSVTTFITTFDGEALYYDKFTYKILDTDTEPITENISTIDEYILEIGDNYEEE